jgi:hypothetical protein
MINLNSHIYREWENVTLILIESGATEEELIIEVKNLVKQVKEDK